MKTIKNFTSRIGSQLSKRLVCLSLFLLSNLSHASNNSNSGSDIVATILSGSIGKTLGKSGALWTLLIAISFAVGGFYAAIKHDPKAFIPAFIVMCIISTVTGMFLSF